MIAFWWREALKPPLWGFRRERVKPMKCKKYCRTRGPPAKIVVLYTSIKLCTSGKIGLFFTSNQKIQRKKSGKSSRA